MTIRRLALAVSLLTIFGCCLLIAASKVVAIGEPIARVLGLSPEQVWRRECKTLFAEMTSPDAQVLYVEYDGDESETRFTVNGKIGTGLEALEEINRWFRKKEAGPVVFVEHQPCIDGGWHFVEDAPIFEKIEAIQTEQHCITIGNSASSSRGSMYFLGDCRTKPSKPYFAYSPIAAIPLGIDIDGFVRGLQKKYKTDKLTKTGAEK